MLKYQQAKKQNVYSLCGGSGSVTAVNGELQSGERSQADVIIVGAGVAGAALAHSLAKDGRNVHVIERDLSEPNMISGELLHPGGYLKLTELGLEGMVYDTVPPDCVEDIDAQRVVGYEMYKDGKHITSTYPLEKFSSNVSGRAFYNGRFVQKLRETAASLPNVQLEQGTVTSLVEEHGLIKGVHYKTKNGENFKAYAPLTVACDGCTSNLRRSLCSPKVEVTSHFVGLVLKNCQLSSPNHGHIVVSLLLFYPISSAEVRCLVPSEREPFITSVDEGNIRTLPVRTMPATPQPINAYSELGAGMTVALSDVVILRHLVRHVQDLNDSAALFSYLESFYILRKPMSSIINIMADIFYKFLAVSPDEAHMEMRDSLFDYLSRGGECLSVPTVLLSGLNPNSLRLVAPLLTVAAYAFGRLLLPFPSPDRLWLGLRLLMGASDIILPLFEAEGLEQMLFSATFPKHNK